MTEPRAYDHIVSLGHDCRVAYNLRRTFAFDRAFPFDWWVTPLPALQAFLHEPSLDRLYDPALLEEVMSEKGVFSIRNAHFDIELHHEFPRHAKTNLVLPGWKDHIPQARPRTEHLMHRFLGLEAGSRILFVRSIKKQEGRELRQQLRPLVEDLHGRLCGLFPGSEVTLLLIDPPDRIEPPGVMNLWIRDANKAAWWGTPELWTKGLLGAGISWTGSPSRMVDLANPEADHQRLLEIAAAEFDPA